MGGAQRLAGVCISAVTRTRSPIIAVKIDKALMPGSNTPKPPRSSPILPRMPMAHIFLPAIETDFSCFDAIQAFAAPTPAAKRECQLANKVTRLADA